MRLTTAAKKIARVLETGSRSANVLRGLIVRPRSNGVRGDADLATFEHAIGQLFLCGMIKSEGRTKGRKIALNGRRTGEAFRK